MLMCWRFVLIVRSMVCRLMCDVLVWCVARVAWLCMLLSECVMFTCGLRNCTSVSIALYDDECVVAMIMYICPTLDVDRLLPILP